jgi:GNAT superfamily N-acetyltransferase
VDAGSISVEARRAEAGDLARLIELDAEARAGLVTQRGGILRLRREVNPFDPAALDDQRALVVVGVINEVIIGFASVAAETLGDGGELAVLGGLYVEPDGREVGVGEAMMDLVLAWCEERGSGGIDAVALPGDRATKNFFERYGLTARAIVVHRALGRAERLAP